MDAWFPFLTRVGTPLVLAVEESRNLALILLLLEKGGVVQPALSLEGESVLKSLKSCKLLILAKEDPGGTLAGVCSDIISEIALKIIWLVERIPMDPSIQNGRRVFLVDANGKIH